MRCFGVTRFREIKFLAVTRNRALDRQEGIRPMTITARERAFGLYKDGYATATKIKKQLEAEGFEGVSRGNIENWRRRSSSSRTIFR